MLTAAALGGAGGVTGETEGAVKPKRKPNAVAATNTAALSFVRTPRRVAACARWLSEAWDANGATWSESVGAEAAVIVVIRGALRHRVVCGVCCGARQKQSVSGVSRRTVG